MFWSLIQYLTLAIQNLGEEGLKEAKTSGWALENRGWVFQRWCPAQECLVVDTRRRALPQSELLPLIQSIQDHLHRETLSRFHATKKLEEGMEGKTVRLFMDVAFSAPEANALFEKLSQLQGSAALQVAGIQFRRESLQRPPALQQLMALSWGYNPSYINSAIRALLWTLSAADRHYTEAQASSGRWGLTSAGLQAYRFLRSLPPRPHFLPGMLLWGMLFRGWARAHAQHDCAEFVAFVAARLCPQVFEGVWMARRSEEHRGVVALDTHTLRGSSSSMSGIPKPRYTPSGDRHAF